MRTQVFTQGFEPTQIEHRESQIEEITKVFLKFLEFGYSSNLYLSGRTGTGKTTCVKRVMKQFDNLFIYATGITHNTPSKIIKALGDSTSSSVERAISDLCAKLNKERKVLIIDEVNKISDQRTFFNYLNAIFREVSVPIIIISNRPRLFDSMDDDARKTLLFERIDFKKYNAEELYDIVMGRIKLLNGELDYVIPEGSIRKICGISALDGSARDSLFMTFRCLISKDFSEEHIERLQKRIEQEEWEEFVNSLKKNECLFLKACLELYASEKQITNRAIQEKVSLSPARISQLITTFIDYGIIDAVYRWGYGGKGRGRYRELTFVTHELFTKLDGLVQ